MFEGCCEKTNVVEEVGPVDLATGKQFAMLICTNCGSNFQVWTEKNWYGEELDKLRQEAGVSSEDLREANEAYQSCFESRKKRGATVTFDPEAVAKMKDAMRKVIFDPEPNSGTSSQ